MDSVENILGRTQPVLPSSLLASGHTPSSHPSPHPESHSLAKTHERPGCPAVRNVKARLDGTSGTEAAARAEHSPPTGLCARARASGACRKDGLEEVPRAAVKGEFAP